MMDPTEEQSCSQDLPKFNSSNDLEVDRFKESFKKYRSWKKAGFTDNGGIDSCSVDIVDVDADINKQNILKRREILQSVEEEKSCCQCGSTFFGLKPVQDWEVYDFTFPAGLIFIKNPFTSEGQRYWIIRSLSDYHEEPYVTNIDNLGRVNTDKMSDISLIRKNTDEFFKKLRWVTFGYHHDWDTKVYSDSYKCEFPPDLGLLTKYIANVLNFKDFKAEAAIVNYYHLDSTLSGHIDRSEVNQQAPLFSLSFGQTAVFLIGGRTKDVKPAAVFLRSGDFVVMTGESRFSYHGVPCILSTNSQPWLLSNREEVNCKDDNTNETQIDLGKFSKRPKLDIDSSHFSFCCSNCDQSLYIHPCNPIVNKVLQMWNNFYSDYVSKCRINLNIRQVLFPGQTSLESVKGKSSN